MSIVYAISLLLNDILFRTKLTARQVRIPANPTLLYFRVSCMYINHGNLKTLDVFANH